MTHAYSKKVLEKVLLLNIAQKSAQKRDKLLKCDKFAQKSAQKSQIYSLLSRVLKKVLKKEACSKKKMGINVTPRRSVRLSSHAPTVLAKF